MQSKYVFGAVVVLAIVLVAYYAWSAHRGEGFETPQVPDHPDLQPYLDNLFLVLSDTKQVLRNLEATAYSRIPKNHFDEVVALLPETIVARRAGSNLATKCDVAIYLLSRANRQYQLLSLTDKSYGVVTPHKLGQSYSTAYGYVLSMGADAAELFESSNAIVRRGFDGELLPKGVLPRGRSVTTMDESLLASTSAILTADQATAIFWVAVGRLKPYASALKTH